MEDREEQFLKNAFKTFDPDLEISGDFNEHVFKKVNTQNSLGIQMLHYLRVLGPILFVSLLGGILFMIFQREWITSSVLQYLPSLKPWHIFMAIIIIYFHFVRSVLILAFLYLKNGFKRAGSLAH